MASLRALPALKEGTLEAAIFIFWPVWGFLPSLALRSLTQNLPKPVILTSSPPLSVSVTTRSKASKCLWASLVGTSASLAILSISSVLFMVLRKLAQACSSGKIGSFLQVSPGVFPCAVDLLVPVSPVELRVLSIKRVLDKRVRVHDYTPRKGKGYIAAFLAVSGDAWRSYGAGWCRDGRRRSLGGASRIGVPPFAASTARRDLRYRSAEGFGCRIS